mmetsp:Transcript_17506/g.56359  ORF Transcript_17506/g.56359 Transcript_17506/m.56359 type:complete len:224 (-) Transcript_17506:233-904(-)
MLGAARHGVGGAARAGLRVVRARPGPIGGLLRRVRAALYRVGGARREGRGMVVPGPRAVGLGGGSFAPALHRVGRAAGAALARAVLAGPWHVLDASVGRPPRGDGVGRPAGTRRGEVLARGGPVRVLAPRALRRAGAHRVRGAVGATQGVVGPRPRPLLLRILCPRPPRHGVGRPRRPGLHAPVCARPRPVRGGLALLGAPLDGVGGSPRLRLVVVGPRPRAL